MGVTLGVTDLPPEKLPPAWPATGKLTGPAVRNAKPEASPYKLAGGGGLFQDRRRARGVRLTLLVLRRARRVVGLESTPSVPQRVGGLERLCKRGLVRLVVALVSSATEAQWALWLDRLGGEACVYATEFAHDLGRRMKASSQGSQSSAASEFDDALQVKLVKTVRIN